MRLLPRQFHGARTIIMSTPDMALSTSRDMLLDAENEDAERVKSELGSGGAQQLKKAPSDGTALVGDDVSFLSQTRKNPV